MEKLKNVNKNSTPTKMKIKQLPKIVKKIVNIIIYVK